MMNYRWIYFLGICLITVIITACSSPQNDKDISQKENEGKENITNESENNSLNDLNENNEDHTNEETAKDLLEENEEDLSIIALVNKAYSLDENYTPEDLVTVDVPTVLDNPEVKQLRKVAAEALKLMFDQAEESDVYLHARSGYRSYQTQVQLFQNYADAHGEEAANRYSARPGQSEHQTGLVMDVTSESVNFQLEEDFGETMEGKWLRDHAHEFGFIVRYPKGKEDITGYIYEPWHIRYLGIDMATAVYESGLTYEEYLEKEGILDEVIP